MATEYPGTVKKPFELGAFRVDPLCRIISGPDGESSIEPKIMAVLLMLCARPGEVVTRQEFIESIWATEFGGDESLTRAVSQLRRTLGDANGQHRYIITVPKTGYRLAIRPEMSAPIEIRQQRRGIVLAGVIGLLVILMVSVYFQKQATEPVLPESPAGKASVVLAVLPFDIQGEGTEDQPLAFGVADEILSALSRNPSIAVIAGHSSFQFTGDRKNDLSALSSQFNISHVVDGSLLRSPEGLRVGVHLIDTSSGLVEWSDVVTRPESEIYTIPGEVAAGVQRALGTEPVAKPVGRSAPDPTAYQSYLYARTLLHTPWGENLYLAIKELENAVALDPDLSEAWSTLAMTLVEMSFSEGPANPGPDSAVWTDRLQAARNHADTALAIDPAAIEAQLALVLIDYREQAASLVETFYRLRSLLARAPNHPKVNFRVGLLMAQVGRFEEATRYLGRALELDPLTILYGALYADTLLCSGEMQKAMQFIEAQGVSERFQTTYTGLVMNLLAGDFQAARDGFTNLGPKHVFTLDGVMEIASINFDSPHTQNLSRLIARLIDVAEQAGAARDFPLASDLNQAADEGLILHFYVAQLMAAGGLMDEAIELVMQRNVLGDTLVRESGILVRPAFRQARQNPGVMELFAETGQLDYWLKTETWPDFCADPLLPYNCEDIAFGIRE